MNRLQYLEVENGVFGCMKNDPNTVIYHSEKRDGYVEVEFTGKTYKPAYQDRRKNISFEEVDECLEGQRPNNTDSRSEIRDKKYFPEM